METKNNSGVNGWVARDKDDLGLKGQLHFFFEKPSRYGIYWGDPSVRKILISEKDFPQGAKINWNNSPVEVTLNININS